MQEYEKGKKEREGTKREDREVNEKGIKKEEEERKNN